MRKHVCLLSAAVLVCGLSVSSMAQERDRPRDGERERPREGERDRPREGDRGPEGRPGGFMRMLPVMAALDADSDGQISAAEIENAVAALTALDKNEDGKLAEDELRPSFPGGPGGGGGGRGFPGGGRGGPEGGLSGPLSPEAFADRMLQGDEDKDGKLSREELVKMAGQFGRGGAGGFGGGRGRPEGEGGRPRPEREEGRRHDGEGGRPERPE